MAPAATDSRDSEALKSQPELKTRRTIVATWLITMVLWFVTELLWCWRFASGRTTQSPVTLARLAIYCIFGIIWCFAGLSVLIYWARQAKKSGRLAGDRSFVLSES